MRGKLLWVTLGSLVLTYPFQKGVWMAQYRTLVVDNRTAIVTGATGNQGKAIALQLATRKFRVIMACRDMERCKATRREIIMMTGNKSVICRRLDLEDINSINKFVDQISEEEPHIDVLINNAAIKELGKKEMTKYGVEKMFFVNFIAPFLLTLRLEPKLLQSADITHDSRIINQTGKPDDSWDVNLNDINFEKRKYSSKEAYKQSKLALAYFTILLEKRCKDKSKDIYVFGTSPGWKSKRIIESMHREVTFLDHLKGYYDTYFNVTGDRVVQPVIKCSIDPWLRNRQWSGLLYSYFMTYWSWGKASEDETKAKLVWNLAADILLNTPVQNQPKIGPE